MEPGARGFITSLASNGAALQLKMSPFFIQYYICMVCIAFLTAINISYFSHACSMQNLRTERETEFLEVPEESLNRSENAKQMLHIGINLLNSRCRDSFLHGCYG